MADFNLMGRSSAVQHETDFAPHPMVMRGTQTNTKEQIKVHTGHLDTERLQSQAPTKYTGRQFACKFSLLRLRVSYRLEAFMEQTQNSKLILKEVFQIMDIKLI